MFRSNPFCVQIPWKLPFWVDKNAYLSSTQLPLWLTCHTKNQLATILRLAPIILPTKSISPFGHGILRPCVGYARRGILPVAHESSRLLSRRLNGIGNRRQIKRFEELLQSQQAQLDFKLTVSKQVKQGEPGSFPITCLWK